MSIKLVKLLICCSLLSYSTFAQNQDTTENEIEFVEEFPRFPGCEDKYETNSEKKSCADMRMRAFLAKNAGYPKSARENNEQGTVYVRFVVKENGTISDVELVKDMANSEALVEASLNAVRAMNDLEDRWTPGKNADGEVVPVRMVVPIKFRLNNDPVKKQPKKKKKFLGIF